MKHSLTISKIVVIFKYSFMFTSSALLAGAVVIFFGLVPSPNEIGLPDPDSEENENQAGESGDEETQQYGQPDSKKTYSLFHYYQIVSYHRYYKIYNLFDHYYIR